MGSKPSGISGSRSSTVLGLNKYQTPFQVWQLIMEEQYPGFNASKGYLMPPEVDNAPIRWGNAFESAVIGLAEDVYGCQIGDREEFYSIDHNGVPITCHIDGLYSGGNTDGQLHEGKTTNIHTFNKEWGEAGTDRIPQEYSIQVQHQMLCTGAEETIVSVLVFPKRTDDFEAEGWKAEYSKDTDTWFISLNDQIVYPDEWASVFAQAGFFHQYKIKANKEIQDLLLAKYSKWWQDHIVGKTPPEEMDYEDILRMIPKPVGTVVVDEESELQLKHYNKITAVQSRLEKKKKGLRVDLLQKYPYGVEEEGSADKIIFKGSNGGKLATYNGKRFTGG